MFTRGEREGSGTKLRGVSGGFEQVSLRRKLRSPRTPFYPVHGPEYFLSSYRSFAPQESFSPFPYLSLSESS